MNFYYQIEVKKQRTAFPPNYVHSLDGTHMMMTAVACRDAGLQFAGFSPDHINFLFSCVVTFLCSYVFGKPALAADDVKQIKTFVYYCLCRSAWFILDACMWCGKDESNSSRKVCRAVWYADSRKCENLWLNLKDILPPFNKKGHIRSKVYI